MFKVLSVLALYIACAQAFNLINHGLNRPSVARSHLSMLKEVVGGSVVALVTPMKPDGAIDYPKLVDLLKWHVDQGTDGAVILGTTGEASMISMDERKEIIKTSVETVNGAFPIIVGTGTIETGKVIQLSQQALQCGADASLVITPYYIKPPQRALVQHFSTIAKEVPLPMILYNCPGRTGVDLKPETIGEIASNNKNIIGVKDATGDLSRIQAIRNVSPLNFLIYSGEDDSGCDFVRLGGDGVISVTANVAPKMMHQMLMLSKMGQKSEAEKINNLLMPLHKKLFCEANPIPVKKALELMGRIGSGIRRPLVPLADEHISIIRDALTTGKAL